MFKASKANWIGSLFVFVVLAACGGGGSDGGGGTTSPVTPVPPPTGAVIAHASDYWQAASGSTWMYEGRAIGTTYYRNRTTLGAPIVFGGRTLTRFEYTDALNDGPSPQYRAFSSEGIRTYLEIAPSDPRYSYIELPAEIRKETFRAFDVTEASQGGTMRISIDVTVAGLENVTLPAGEFLGALRTTHTVTVVLTTPDGSGQGTSTIDYWYAKGIGIIKQVFTDPNYAPPYNTYAEELAGVITTNVKAGVVGEYTWLSNLGPGTTYLSMGKPGVATDGTGYLVVARAIEPVATGYVARLVATYVLPDGSTRFSGRVIVDNLGAASTTSEYGPVHVAWDGSRFWVVTEAVDGGVVRQRVGTDGTLFDGPAGTVLVSDGRQPAVAVEDGIVLIAYVGRTPELPVGWNVYADTYTSGGVLQSGGTLLTRATLTLPEPAVTGHAGGFLVAWDTGERVPVGMRVGLQGQPLDTQPAAFSTAGWGTELAGWGGGSFIALWQDLRMETQNSVRAARMTASGSMVDAVAVQMCGLSTQRFGTAAADGTSGTLLAWTVGSYALAEGQPPGIFGRAFKPGVDLTASVVAVRYGMLMQEDYGSRLMYPAAAAGADGFAVVWANNAGSGLTNSVRGVLVYPQYGN